VPSYLHKLIRIVYEVLKSEKPFDQTNLAIPVAVLEQGIDLKKAAHTPQLAAIEISSPPNARSAIYIM